MMAGPRTRGAGAGVEEEGEWQRINRARLFGKNWKDAIINVSQLSVRTQVLRKEQ